MKVILVNVVPKLGRIGDVVVVKSGYAKNFLIPNKKAICFSDANYKVFESKKQEFEHRDSKKVELATNFKSLLEGKNIIIIENASDDGRLYGSVNSNVIVKKVNNIIGENSISCSEILLRKPIKEVGIYEAKLLIHPDVDINVRLVVGRTESETNFLLNPNKKSADSAENNQDSKEQQITKKPRNKKPS